MILFALRTMLFHEGGQDDTSGTEYSTLILQSRLGARVDIMKPSRRNLAMTAFRGSRHLLTKVIDAICIWGQRLSRSYDTDAHCSSVATIVKTSYWATISSFWFVTSVSQRTSP